MSAPGARAPQAADPAARPGARRPAPAPGAAPGARAPRSAPLPRGVGIALDPGVRRLDGGRALLGGVPLRLVRLSPAGARVAAAWARGERPAADGARMLARRLLDAGIAHPRPSGAGAPRLDEVTVIVPVRDRPRQLRRCLAAVAAAERPGAGPRRLVVDDGSQDAEAVAAVAAQAGARLLRRERAGGPAAARNSGLAQCSTPFVAFVDSDCLPAPGWLSTLLAHLADPQVGAVAPRIVAHPAARDGWLAQYEERFSPLDMGAREGPVAPLRRVPYVPTAALVARRAALGDGFDPELTVGEDVDLVWRMTAAGWTVRYEPAAAVAHDHRVTVAAWLRRRAAYGTSAAPLHRRHPGAVPAAVASPSAAAAWLLLAARRPRAALLAAALATAAAARRLDRTLPRPAGAGADRPPDRADSPARAGAHRDPPRPLGGPTARPSLPGDHRDPPPPLGGLLPSGEAMRLAAIGVAASGRSLSSALTRPWLPAALLVALRSRRARAPLAAGVLLPRAFAVARERGRLDLPRALVAAVADDAAYAAGLWWGCLRHRTLGPLLPSRGRIRRRG